MTRYARINLDTGELSPLPSYRFRRRTKRPRSRIWNSDRHVTFIALVVALAALIMK